MVFRLAIPGESRHSSLSQRAQSLGGTLLRIGETPIQSRGLGLILPLKELGQESYALTLSLCEL